MQHCTAPTMALILRPAHIANKRRNRRAQQSGEEVNVATKRIDKPAKKPVSSKVQAVEKRYRGEAKADRTRKRQIEYERPDRGGPQGRKDKDFQRKH
jgi:hypothetical protein